MTRFVSAVLVLWSSIAVSVLSRTIPDNPTSSFAWTNATSATIYNNYVIATSKEGLMSHINGVQQSQLPLPSSPIGLKMFGNMILVLTRSQEFFLVTINDFGRLILLNRYDPGGDVLDYEFDHNTIYIARGFHGVDRYEYTWQGRFDWTDSSMIPVHCTDLAYQYPLLLAVDDYNGVVIYDITDSTLDYAVDRRLVPYQINDIAISGRFVVATSLNDVMLGGVLDLSGRKFVRLDSLTRFESQNVYFHDSSAFAVGNDSVRFARWIGHPTSRITSRMTLTKGIRPSISIGNDGLSSQFLRNTFAAAIDGTIVTFAGGTSQNLIAPAQYTTETGPYSNVKIIDSTVYVGGPNYPLQAHQFTADGRLGLPRHVIPGLVNIRDFDIRNDTVLVLSPVDRAVMLYNISDPIDPVIVRRIPVDTNFITEARFVDWPTDTMTVVAISGLNSVLLYTIRDTLPTENPARIFMLGRILDYAFVDSMMVVLSNKRTMDVFQLHDDLSVDFQGTTPTINSATKFFNFSSPGSFGDTINQLFLLGGTQIARLDLTNPQSPLFDEITNIGIPLSDVTVQRDTIYAVGSSGIARLQMDNGVPVVREIGGRSGSIITRSGNLLVSSSGESAFLYELEEDILTDVDDDLPVQPELESILSQNWPNPFNPQTTIPYSLPLTGPVRLTIFNILGQEVTTLVDQTQTAGNYTVEWNGRDQSGIPVASGLYLYRLELPDRAEARKMMLVR